MKALPNLQMEIFTNTEQLTVARTVLFPFDFQTKLQDFF